MEKDTLLILVLGGVVLWMVMGRARTNSPTVAAGYPGMYIPPAQAVPTWGGRPSPAAPGAMGWGFIPPQPTDAQQAASVLTAIGALGTGIGNAASGIGDAINGGDS